MNLLTGRPDNIEDWLAKQHTGRWFKFSDPNNKTYANLVILDDTKTKPTEAECNAGLAALQSEFDSKVYIGKRSREYPSLQEFAEAYCEKEINGDNTKWNDYQTKYNAVRTKYPKPSEE